MRQSTHKKFNTYPWFICFLISGSLIGRIQEGAPFCELPSVHASLYDKILLQSFFFQHFVANSFFQHFVANPFFQHFVANPFFQHFVANLFLQHFVETLFFSIFCCKHFLCESFKKNIFCFFKLDHFLLFLGSTCAIFKKNPFTLQFVSLIVCFTDLLVKQS